MADDSLMNEFFADTQGHLDNIEEDTLRLEKNPTDAELIGDVFRRVHSIKGNAGIMGLGAIYNYGQEFEAFLDGVRERKVVTPAEIERIFKQLDGFKSRINELRGESAEINPDQPAPDTFSSGPELSSREEADRPEASAEAPQALFRARQEPEPTGAIGPAKAAAIAQSQEPMTALTFMIGGEMYGIDIMRVKEIITYERVTRVPNTKPYVDGVMNLRDQVIPVFDLRKKLRIKSANGHAVADRERSIIVVDISKVITGLAVDYVSGIKVFDPSSITRPESFAGKISAEFLMGVGQMDDEAVIILNAVDVCDPAEMLY